MLLTEYMFQYVPSQKYYHTLLSAILSKGQLKGVHERCEQLTIYVFYMERYVPHMSAQGINELERLLAESVMTLGTWLQHRIIFSDCKNCM
jgi:hypothetical protein